MMLAEVHPDGYHCGHCEAVVPQAFYADHVRSCLESAIARAAARSSERHPPLVLYRRERVRKLPRSEVRAKRRSVIETVLSKKARSPARDEVVGHLREVIRCPE